VTLELDLKLDDWAEPCVLEWKQPKRAPGTEHGTPTSREAIDMINI
jgi:hypothetical protein